MPEHTVIIRPELPHSQALALAQFLKRVGWSEMRGCAVDDSEAYLIRAALGALRTELAEIGFNPR